ncbi:hypothetical protein [Methylocella sp.]|uniref:hypothetical protein n=1 Tax=Methylocella sp. TaxID=1978226 RepID=UPI00378419B7
MASFIWIVAGPIIYNNRIQAEAERAIHVHRHECLSVQDVFFDACLADGQRQYENDIRQTVTMLEWTVASVIYLAVATIAAYVIYLIARWVLAGRAKAT